MDELNKQFSELQKKYRIFTISLLVFLAAGVLAFIIKGAIGLAFIAVAVICGVMVIKSQKTLKEFYVHNIISTCFRECSFIEDLKYIQDKGIPASTVEAAGMINTGTSVSSKDLVTGTYNGKSFAKSYVTIVETTYVGDDRTESTIFGGNWLSFDLGRDVGCNIQAVSNKFRAEAHIMGYSKLSADKLPAVACGEKSFADSFTVYTNDIQAARAALNGAFPSALMKLLSENKEPLMLMVLGSTVHVAMFKHMQALEPSFKGNINVADEKERVMSELRMLTDFIGAVVL